MLGSVSLVPKASIAFFFLPEAINRPLRKLCKGWVAKSARAPDIAATKMLYRRITEYSKPMRNSRMHAVIAIRYNTERVCRHAPVFI